jgi:prepilin-type N-terminal cleavage/methylation domain-containing protein
MNNQLSKLKSVKKEEGFTIVEVMIVLAIAGLILLIVFLAVPALQRNSRNTAIKNDASNIAAGINDFKSSYEGALPTTLTNASGTVSIANGTNSVTAKVQGGTTINALTTVASTVTTATTPTVARNTIYVYTDAKCSSQTQYVYAKNQSAVFYAVETGGTDAVKCQDI